MGLCTLVVNWGMCDLFTPMIDYRSQHLTSVTLNLQPDYIDFQSSIIDQCTHVSASLHRCSDAVTADRETLPQREAAKKVFICGFCKFYFCLRRRKR